VVLVVERLHSGRFASTEVSKRIREHIWSHFWN